MALILYRAVILAKLKKVKKNKRKVFFVFARCMLPNAMSKEDFLYGVGRNVDNFELYEIIHVKSIRIRDAKYE